MKKMSPWKGDIDKCEAVMCVDNDLSPNHLPDKPDLEQVEEETNFLL